MKNSSSDDNGSGGWQASHYLECVSSQSWGWSEHWWQTQKSNATESQWLIKSETTTMLGTMTKVCHKKSLFVLLCHAITTINSQIVLYENLLCFMEICCTFSAVDWGGIPFMGSRVVDWIVKLPIKCRHLNRTHSHFVISIIDGHVQKLKVWLPCRSSKQSRPKALCSVTCKFGLGWLLRARHISGITSLMVYIRALCTKFSCYNHK